MVYISSVRIRGRSNKYIEVSQTIAGIIDQAKFKKGCLTSIGSQDIEDKNTFYLVEEWQTRKDMDEYLQSKLFSALLGTKTILVEEPEVKIMVEEKTL